MELVSASSTQPRGMLEVSSVEHGPRGAVVESFIELLGMEIYRASRSVWDKARLIDTGAEAGR